MTLRNRSFQTRRSFSALTLALAGGGLSLFGGLHSAQSQTTIVQNFAGTNESTEAALPGGFDLAPPDTDGNIGPGSFVQFTNGSFTAFSTTGTQQSIESDTAFWNAAGISTTLTGQGLSDPRIKYDAGSGLWFASEITLGTNSVNNSVLLAVSKDSNIADGFKATSFQAVSATRFGDFPTLGVDANGVYVGTNNFSAAGNFTGTTFTSIPKTSIEAGTTTGIAKVTSTSSAIGFAPQGVNNSGTGYTTGQVVGVSATAYYQSKVTSINNPGAAGATLGTTHTDTLTYDGAPSYQHQPNGSRTLDGGGDNRISAATVQVGNNIYAVNAINNGNTSGSQTAAGFDSVHWMVYNATTGALSQEGIISEPNVDLTYPSIAVNSLGTVVIGFAGAGTSLNISSMADVGHLGANGTLVFDAPITLFTGSVNNYTDGFGETPSRFGDYSATSVDPTDPTKFWTIQEIPESSTLWGTEVTEISTAVPEPGTWALLGFGGAVALLAVGKRRKLA